MRIPPGLRLASELSWRFLVVGAAIVVVALVLARLRLVVVPLFVALLLATVLWPAVAALRRRRWPRALAALGVLASSLAVLAAVAAVVVPAVAADIDELDVGVRGGAERLEAWLIEGPLDLSREQVGNVVERGERQLRENASTIAGGAVSGAVVFVELAAGSALTLVLLFFFLKDGDRMWRWVRRLFPVEARDEVDAIGARVWHVLGGFVRGTALVALVDALGIGLALWLIGVPLVLPLAVLTFLGGFVPLVGATVAGFAAAMVALVSGGFTTAILVLAAVIAVQQLEGNVLQPFIVGRNVELHPIAVLLAVAVGGILWGIIGAFLAVPITAAVAAAAAALSDTTGEGAPGASSRT